MILSPEKPLYEAQILGSQLWWQHSAEPSDPQSNGISKAYAKAAEFITPQTPVTSAISLKTAYDNKYGAPSAGTPKVFVKYFYVNTVTGEKSGDMLAVARFAATNGQPEPENQGGGDGEDENPEQGLGF